MPNQPNLVVVGGERYWHELLPECRVIYCRLQVSRWLIQDGKLHICTEFGPEEVHAVLWRVGVIQPEPWHRAVLDMIRITGIPCVNSAEALLRGFDKLSMYAEMKSIGLPVIPVEIAVGMHSIQLLKPRLPCVLKVGNHHGGLGKARAVSGEQWRDLADLAAIVPDYSLAEPYIDYEADVRCLIAGDRIWCLRRESEDWKVNRGIATPVLIETPDVLEQWTHAAAQHLNAYILGLDFIQTPDGEWLLLECNDVPGLEGFPETVRMDVASCLRTHLA